MENSTVEGQLTMDALYAAVTAIASLNGQTFTSGCLVRSSTEESGSVDLPAYTEALADLIAIPDVVDSGVAITSRCG